MARAWRCLGKRRRIMSRAAAEAVMSTVAYVRSLAQGLRIEQGEGEVEVFEPLERFYAENVSAQFAAGATPGKTREPVFERRTREAGARVYGYRYPHHLPLLR